MPNAYWKVGPNGEAAGHTTFPIVKPTGQVTGTGKFAPGPGCNPKFVATAPKSKRFSATLDADPSNNPYDTPSFWKGGIPVASKVSTEAACEGVNCTFTTPPGVGNGTLTIPQGPVPDAPCPMLENPVSSRSVSS